MDFDIETTAKAAASSLTAVENIVNKLQEEMPVREKMTEDEILNGNGKNYKERLDALREMYKAACECFRTVSDQHMRSFAECQKLGQANEKLEKANEHLQSQHTELFAHLMHLLNNDRARTQRMEAINNAVVAKAMKFGLEGVNELAQ